MSDLILELDDEKDIELSLDDRAMPYILPPATDETLGGIKTDSANGIYLDEENRLHVEDRQARALAQSAKDEAESARTAADDAKAQASTAQAVANEAKDEAHAANLAAESAQDTAQNAQADALTAKSDASSALTAAQEATNTANNALSEATTASQTAGEAKTLASTAQTTAEGAQSAADAAQTTAGDALAAAQGAQSTADGAVSAASQAQQTADNASSAASTAQQTAENAATAASQAQTTADNAATAAASAATAAASASGAASTAQQTADSAAAAAAAAQQTADGKQDALVSGENIKTINNESILGAGNLEILTEIPPATDTELGGVKLNPDKGITLSGTDQLEVEGRFGQTTEGGLYLPITATPTLVEARSILMAGISGLSVANGSLALLRGTSITVKSAPAGATEYHIENNYLNRLKCAGLQTPGAVCILDEATEATGVFSNVLSCKINGAAFVPDSAPDDPNNDIIITVDRSANPDTATTSIRFYHAALKSSSFYAGQMVGGGGGNLANVVVGQNVFSEKGNAVCMIAQQSHNTGAGNAIFGRYHYVTRNRWLVSGAGHEVAANARQEAGAVFGQYADIKPDTVLAVGNGKDQLNRSNAFEVKDDGTITPKRLVTENVAITIPYDPHKEVVPDLTTTYWRFTNGGAFATYDGVTGFRLPDAAGKAVNAQMKNAACANVTPGQVLKWSYDVRKTSDNVTGNLIFNLIKTNMTGSAVSNNYVVNNAASAYSTEWKTITGEFVVPDGMDYMKIQFARSNVGAGSTGAYEVRNLSILQPVDSGIVLTSPGGNKFKLTVADDGTLGTVAV